HLSTDPLARSAGASRRHIWGFWLPAAVCAALLLIIGATYFRLSRHIEALGDRLIRVLEPATIQLTQVQLSFLDELSAWRAHQTRPSEASLAQVNALHERTRNIVNGLSATAGRAGPDLEREVGTLRQLLQAWEATPVGFTTRQVSPEESNRAQAQREDLSGSIEETAARIQ